jgi:hypothetical protein
MSSSGQRLSIRRKRYAPDSGTMPAQGRQLTLLCDVPKLDCVIAAGGRESFAVGRKSKAIYRMPMRTDDGGLTCLQIPEACRSAKIAGGKKLAIRTEAQREYSAF